MRIDKVKIKDFKNLKDATIDFDETKTTSVVIGKNGAGKSNLLEALVIIFRDLDLDEATALFDYEIAYHCRENLIEITNTDGKRTFVVNNVSISKSAFLKKKNEYLPSNVFAYYSGNEKRMEEHFAKHQRKFYDEMLYKGEGKFRRLFFARPVHSNFVLLAFFALADKKNSEFLKKYLDIDSMESVLFITHKPEWYKKNNYEKSDFWGAKGYVKDFLDDIYELCLAPITESVKVKTGIKSTKNTEFTYLFLKDQQVLNRLADSYQSETEFFKYLESTYINDLLEEVRIKVKKIDGSVVTFNELSEGEQQLLTVLGLMKFTEKEEALFLLDEPDTHLNPKWKYEYLKLIENISGKNENSQVILSTHDPIVIGGLKKESVIIFEKDSVNKTIARNPEKDPEGMGVAAILTSDVFDLPTTLDSITQEKWDRERVLYFKEHKSQDEKKELESLKEELEDNGFLPTTRDPLYNKFLERLYKRSEYIVSTTDWSDKEIDLFDSILEEIKEEEKDELH